MPHPKPEFEQVISSELSCSIAKMLEETTLICDTMAKSQALPCKCVVERLQFVWQEMKSTDQWQMTHPIIKKRSFWLRLCLHDTVQQRNLLSTRDVEIFQDILFQFIRFAQIAASQPVIVRLASYRAFTIAIAQYNTRINRLVAQMMLTEREVSMRAAAKKEKEPLTSWELLKNEVEAILPTIDGLPDADVVQLLEMLKYEIDIREDSNPREHIDLMIDIVYRILRSGKANLPKVGSSYVPPYEIDFSGQKR